MNISNKKYALLSIYHLPDQSINFFLDKLSEALDIYSKHYEYICIFRGFNATPENNDMINFMNNQRLSNLNKGPTCFKSANGSMIDLFLTTNKYLFQKTNSFEVGISDYHHLIAKLLKTTYETLLKINYAIQSGDIGSLKSVILKTLNAVAPFKNE